MSFVRWSSILGLFLPLLAQAAPATQSYRMARIVSDGSVRALQTDRDLVNPWGMSMLTDGAFFLANNGTGLATTYNGRGVTLSSPVYIPTALGNTDRGSPTGTVANSTRGFVIRSGGRSAPARTLYATEDGTIGGYSPAVSSGKAIRVVDRAAQDAMYTGLAMGEYRGRSVLYAANFRSRSIDVFDSRFRAQQLRGQFHDETIPQDFAPYNIASIGGKLYISYARRSADSTDDLPGPGTGIIDVFRTNGTLVRRFATSGRLNAPWGMAMAPSSFGRFGGKLLIGNNGDGRISAFDPRTGAFAGQLRNGRNEPLAINGLRDLAFGNGAGFAPEDTLFFTAGRADGAHGLFGSLEPVAYHATSAFTYAPQTVPEPAAPALLVPVIGLAMLRRRRG